MFNMLRGTLSVPEICEHFGPRHSCANHSECEASIQILGTQSVPGLGVFLREKSRDGPGSNLHSEPDSGESRAWP